MKKPPVDQKIITRFEDITPETAKRHLARNDRGDLIDGQHRLSAIVRAGVTVRMLVTRGLPTEVGNTKTMDTVDRGATRSIADQLKLQHGFRNPYRDVGAANAIAQMTCGAEKRKVTKSTVSQILQILEVYGRHIADIGGAMDSSKETRLRRAQFIGALAFARAVDPAIVDRFLAGVIKGSNLAEDSPVLAFRNFLFSDASLRWSQSGDRKTRVAFALIVLNSLCRFAKAEPSKDVHAGNSGYVFFAAKQPENLTRLAKIFLVTPEPLKAEPDQPIREGKSLSNVGSQFVRSAKDFQFTPAAEELIRHAGEKTRVDRMQERIRNGAIAGAIR